MKVTKTDALFRRGLIVSCQALEDEPLHGVGIMARMALAAKDGGAVGLRINGVADILEVKQICDMPVIGIMKIHYAGYEVFITPTLSEVEKLIKAGADIVAVDASRRPRPSYADPTIFIEAIKKEFGIPLMADVSNFEEGVSAWLAGADMVATTLSSYTPYTANREKPDIELVKQLLGHVNIPVIAEGNIETPEQALACMNAGAYAVVVGSAITRPQTITRRFVERIGTGWEDGQGA
ncbi:N-acetylmannosamine-6-phosphate 2-epimerase [Cohnella silvisoli]|uniref:Putative N-acetylmannosamine-6-phosphate 2-epimerase n=1 Tax=Cohnella silvisoli TaxID=2873699 RepID=A0ABV1KRJ9_9BACL|nr:N-acetylmannosamine-6-phosphate 2-epimerase [Cohnella silvisoli]MCD9022430.1 N-acetylmannosamine-6-phosphate 2-epimerase [Cohnella silvisoli]